MFLFINMAQVIKIVLFFALLLSVSSAEPGLRTCEPIRIEMCMGLGYNKTGMPNYGDHERQSDAVVTLRTFQPLIEYGCSAQLKFFLCSVFIPMCTDKVAQPIGPCRGLCEKVRSRCYPVLQGFGFPWPMALNCSRFPSENNHEHMCMEGPSEMTTGFTSVTAHRYHMTPQGPTPCSKLSKSNQYSYINRSGRCVPHCNSDILFESADKSLAEVWLSIWAALCFVSTIVALLSFAVDSQTWGRYPENCLVFLTLCYALVSVGWSIRSAAGRTAVSCKPDETGGRLLMLTEDGLGNANCAVVFILLYYFGMAASVWWVVCCGCWVAVAALRWGQERLQGLSSLLHVAAWGAPAAHTLTVLVRREVVAEELTGICYAGGHNLQTLLWLVLVPHTGCLIVGVVLLVIGAVLLSRRRGPDTTRSAAGNTTTATAVPVTAGSVARNRVKSQVDLLKIGVFALLNTIPLSCLVGSYAYEYWGKTSWLAGNAKPALWVFLLRIFMSLVVGITSCMWVWNPHTVTSWRQFLSRFLPRPGYHQPPVKQHPLPVLRYMPANHSAPHGQQLVGASQSALQPLTGGGTLPSGGRQARVHKHRAGSASGSGRGYHVRSGSETIL